MKPLHHTRTHPAHPPCLPSPVAPPSSPQVLAGGVPLNKFVITKQLTKRPDDYPDARNQPHVQVALRRRAQGKHNGVMAVSEAGGGRRDLRRGWGCVRWRPARSRAGC